MLSPILHKKLTTTECELLTGSFDGNVCGCELLVGGPMIYIVGQSSLTECWRLLLQSVFFLISFWV